MANHREEYFGQPAQRALQRRADHMWTLLKDNPDYSTHGRAVSLAEASHDNLDAQIALARLQGVAAVDGVALDDAQARRDALEAHGLKLDHFSLWEGGSGALNAADAVIRARRLGDDLEIRSVDARTPAEELQKLDALTQVCDVLLPMGSFIRGERRPSVCLYARDREGRVVGASAAVMPYHPQHSKAGKAWWGMLATDPARRGEGIAMILGAHAMRAMNDRHGIERFFTGIREGNTPSEALCTKLGLAATDAIVIIAIDPDGFSGERVTK